MVFHCGNIVEKVLPKAGGSEKRQKGRGHVRGLSIGGGFKPSVHCGPCFDCSKDKSFS